MTLTLFKESWAVITPRLSTETIQWDGNRFTGVIRAHISEAGPVTLRVEGDIELVANRGINLNHPIDQTTILRPLRTKVIGSDTGLDLMTVLEMIQTQHMKDNTSKPVKMQCSFEQLVTDWVVSAYRDHLCEFVESTTHTE